MWWWNQLCAGIFSAEWGDSVLNQEACQSWVRVFLYMYQFSEQMLDNKYK